MCDGALYGLARDGRLLDMTGGSGQQETALRWMAETGELGLSQPENKYLARLELPGAAGGSGAAGGQRQL